MVDRDLIDGYSEQQLKNKAKAYHKIGKIMQYWNDGEDKRPDSEILDDILKICMEE